MSYYFLSENSFIYNISNKLSLDDNLKILNIYKSFIIDRAFCHKYGIYDIVPTYNSIAFHFEYMDIDYLQNTILARIESIDLNEAIDSKIHYVYVDYNGEDLAKVSQVLELDIAEIIKRHTQVEYHIAMLGFKPYFPYLLGLDKSLSVPRLATPRNRIATGSVAIGGSQTTIFPEQSPSGWNIIGVSDFRDFSNFSAGDKIIFRET
ncbi:5-oxoprolinase subunit B family protein [Francisella orientalis]|uniref:5-oxoprolinase subunit B family protein n=1 Tax=Francisella orientalis TaxID=299583 RepID=UPI00142D2F14|nr:carboxyltransferase domain-containing protein [Francisella orientalis]MBK2008192.1 carboxyltransferase domain-containing protein [Francisella orientalis]MBK2022770.1 carboxyltransferase domain-containing protein [Francisella orientalis]MBK2047261.1 carboxyltransferase domain-containing protein [Francisella orientalis]MBK2076937.1 carboxyltransferase domain-containing protein [Francisella orientalis]NIY50079.1 allophanate hydrolase [Francisella orientalis]